MLEKLLNKQEKELFSLKTLNKIKKQDFKAYLDIQENILESLKKQSQLDVKYTNEILKEKIVKQQNFVNKLTVYYNEVILKKEKQVEEVDFITEEFENMIKELVKIQK
ncbi:hypothetical protein [Spiroplasma floricola]|uniref:Uncharacterized protein n=1 Tax=Spiroplasma floricola 23-6 TaxID=1336749 RepID=A0A2K8SDR4_9MOLU|nr:hypothetical protein [Spiroplasma floricola]AUB31597.1 hypothetical protein SFLOR_v1c05450 [Spiroplasma floricola 23-6]